tara:strand:+ start:251 stop:550 length:300 start_codon:yes stop_codon:yes gene_type:complete
MNNTQTQTVEKTIWETVASGMRHKTGGGIDFHLSGILLLLAQNFNMPTTFKAFPQLDAQGNETGRWNLRYDAGKYEVQVPVQQSPAQNGTVQTNGDIPA